MAIEKTEQVDTVKKVLVEALKKLNIISEKWTGEIVIGITDGGIKFVRRSETLK